MFAMFASENTWDPVTVVQLNADLRNAHMELQSANRAADRLRARFSDDEVSYYGDQELVRKAQLAARALQNYFSSIQPPESRLSSSKSTALDLNEEQLTEAVATVSRYVQEQREQFLSVGRPISGQFLATMENFFSPTFLAEIKIVEMGGHRVAAPRFSTKGKERGFEKLLQFTHLSSMTFQDVLIFNTGLTERSLFHALVHAEQIRVLGLHRYTELFVRGFLSTGWRFTVPLEAHAFELDSRFATNPEGSFRVQDEVCLWVEQNRY
jgi:hypothetical protein